MSVRTRGLDIKADVAKLKADRAAREEAELVVDRWNRRPSPFTCDFGQWIVDRFRLTERDDGAISRHGVSLLSGGSGRLDTRLDTPPSIKRRHPDSRIAPLVRPI